ncbi:hypothetical protein CI105_03920 [Candidatus Izimaplasma bacterium ZiA1]|uniref:rhomboid family intramembrane serine protease n=1 Tax=Candidatus Izimoplasma sp. ZiA1 TaxID=2024899 RepID=UPI000BAA8643|nr:hypothetical protein CI105_03920 [Candidatus Izimaplasma bacterium ZiA1]
MFNQEKTLEEFVRNRPLSSLLILINTVMLFLVLLNGGFTNVTLYKFGALWPPALEFTGDYWRIATSMFLHGSLLHFLSNMVIGVMFLSSGLEKLIGSLRFILVYLISGLGAGVLIMFLSDALTIGASGAIFGVLGYYLFLTVNHANMFNRQEISSVRGLILFNIIFTFLSPNISIVGHLGGISIGYLLGFIIKPKNKEVDVYYID